MQYYINLNHRDDMKRAYQTTRFGEIMIDGADIITIPEGPLGFPKCTRFAFVDEEQAKPFRALQSLDNPALAFVVVDPTIVVAEYRFDLTLSDTRLVQADSVSNLVTWVIVTMAKDIQDTTVNLQGPIIINAKNNIGHQFVLVDSDYTCTEPLTIT